MEGMRTGLEHRLRRVMRQIGEQHRHLRQVDVEIERALREGSEILGTWLDRYVEALSAHFALEEEVLFPALHGLDPARGDEIARLERDHGEMLATLDRLRAPDAVDRLAAELARLRERLGDHERREEALMMELAG